MSDLRPLALVIGLLLCLLSLGMLLPAWVDLAAGNRDWQVFLTAAAVTGFVGGALALTTRDRESLRLNLRQAFLLTTLAWTTLAAFGALPFLFYGGGLDYADAFFEAISGLTTTGSTVLIGLDELPRGLLLWRSILQWIGGVGIVVMALLMLPFLRVGGMQLFRAESSDRSEKVVARPVELVSLIGLSYLILTVACGSAYWAAGMSPFDAVNHAMTTVSTGGYSTHDASMGHFHQPAIHWIAVLFMIAGALPFVLYVQALRGRGLHLWQDSQARGLLVFLAAVVLVLAGWLVVSGESDPLVALRLAAFNVVSVVTTTGFASADYGLWGSFAVALFFFLTFVGGCTGSTSGAVKVYRFQVLWAMARGHVRHLFRPRDARPLRYAGRVLPADVPPSVLAFVAVYMTVVAVLTLALAAQGLDLVTSFSAAATAISNVGPGLGPIVGPAGTFAPLPDGAKWLLSAGMLLGRLELFTVLVMLDPEFWRW